MRKRGMGIIFTHLGCESEVHWVPLKKPKIGSVLLYLRIPRDKNMEDGDFPK